MQFFFRPSRLVLAVLATSLAFATACDETTDEKIDVPRGNEGKPGYAEGCKALKGVTDTTKTDKTAITDYLVNACVIGEYFKTESFVESSQKIGSPCYCYGDACSMAGFERPDPPRIMGCDNVPTEQIGAVRGCFRSTNAAPAITPVIHFANGQCTLMMSKCTPSDSYICSFATFGDYTKVDEFRSCPDDNVLIDLDIKVSLSIGEKPQTADLAVRMCVQSCELDSDCRQGEFDPAIGKNSELKCIEIANKEQPDQKAKACIDRRVIDLDADGVDLVLRGRG